jgi:hypothetical protein
MVFTLRTERLIYGMVKMEVDVQNYISQITNDA